MFQTEIFDGLKIESEHLTFVEVARTEKTSKYNVLSKYDDALLGKVSWYPKWRQYVFTPEMVCVWSHDCLLDLSLFVRGLMKARQK